MIIDDNLSWKDQVEKIIKDSRKLLYALRFLNKNVDKEVIQKVFKAQVVSKMTNGASVWSHRLSYTLRARLRSAYYKIPRVLLRDFDMKYNRSTVAKLMCQEEIDQILFKGTSTMLFKLITQMTPACDLATTVLSTCFFNERTPGRLSFFDTSCTHIGRACISNASKNIVKEWEFDWLELDVLDFKRALAQQMDPNV